MGECANEEVIFKDSFCLQECENTTRQQCLACLSNVSERRGCVQYRGRNLKFPIPIVRAWLTSGFLRTCGECGDYDHI